MSEEGKTVTVLKLSLKVRWPDLGPWVNHKRGETSGTQVTIRKQDFEGMKGCAILKLNDF